MQGDSKDEIGDLGKSLNRMAEDLSTKVSAAHSLSEGDLSIQVSPSGDDDRLGHALATMVERLATSMDAIAEAAVAIDDGGTSLMTTANDLSNGASSQAAAIEEVSATMAEISNQAQANSERANEADELSNRAANAANQGGVAVDSLSTTMTNIKEATGDVARITDMIDSIAFQTNLGAQCLGRGGPRWKSWPWLCRGRQ